MYNVYLQQGTVLYLYIIRNFRKVLKGSKWLKIHPHFITLQMVLCAHLSLAARVSFPTLRSCMLIINVYADVYDYMLIYSERDLGHGGGTLDWAVYRYMKLDEYNTVWWNHLTYHKYELSYRILFENISTVESRVCTVTVSACRDTVGSHRCVRSCVLLRTALNNFACFT